MGEIRAQEFEFVGREIGDQEAAARLHRTRGVRDRGTWIVQIVQHLMKKHCVELVAGRKRQPENIGQADLDMMETGHAVARDREHLRADIDTDRAPRMGRDQFEHPPGAGAGIEQVLDRLAAMRARIAASTSFSGACNAPMRSTARHWP